MELSAKHRAMLKASGVSDDLIEQRGYYTTHNKSHLRGLGFSRTQLETISEEEPALVIPVYQHGRTDPVFYQIRPDRARVREGKAVKYETPPNTRMVVDVPPAARDWIGDPQRTLYITEGIKKADAAVSQGLCCVALLGVWNWRGTNQFGGRTALGDWENFAFNDERSVNIVFDSDIVQKRAVHAAMCRLKGLLAARGGDVRLVYLDPDEKGNKVGLDDFLVTVKKGQAQWELQVRAVPEPRPFPADEDEEPEDPRKAQYQYHPRGMVWWKTTDAGKQQVDLANVHARILTDLLLDDGTEDRVRAFEVEAYLAAEKHLNGRATQRFQVRADKFDQLDWVRGAFGARAIIEPGTVVKDRLRHAIQVLSGDVEERVSYKHLGWRKLDGVWTYLHSAGAIGPEGVIEGIRAEPDSMERYTLPDPPEGDEAKEAVRRSLRFLDVAERSQTWPILAAMYTAPLAGLLPCDFVLWIQGETGGRKSSATALALCHFGNFDRGSLPANFDSTHNAVEGLLFDAKDAPAVVDDYNPASDRKTQEKMDQVAHRILSSVGDLRGRSRMTADATMRKVKVPRCMAIATAELPPPGAQSRAARAFQVNWEKFSVNLAELSRAQAEDAPFYGQAMAGYLKYLAPQIDRLRGQLPALVRKEADRMPQSHGRVQDAAAKLYIGVSGFLKYACTVGAITPAQMKTLLDEARGVFAQCAERTGAEQAERKPSVLFMEYLRALISQGRGYLADRKTGLCPNDEPGRWGYMPPRGDEYEPQPRAAAVKFGWVDLKTNRVYLDATTVHEAVLTYSQRAGMPLAGTKRSMGEALFREGLLAVKAEGRWEVSVRCEGAQAWCWALALETLEPPAPEEDPFGPEDPDGDLDGAGGAAAEPPPVACSPGERHVAGEGRSPASTRNGAASGPEKGVRTPPEIQRGGGVPAISGVSGDKRLPGQNGVRNCEEDSAKICHQTCHQNESILESVESNSGGVTRIDSSSPKALESENGAGPGAPRHENGAAAAPEAPRLHDSRNKHTPALPAGARVRVTEPAELPALLSALEGAPALALDLETTGLDPRQHRTRLLSVGTPERTYTVDCFQVDPRPLFPLLRDRLLFGHNLQFDLSFLWELGFRPGPVEDTIHFARLLSAADREMPKGYHGLDQVALRTVGVELPKTEQKSNWAGPLSDSQWDYAARDVEVLWPVREVLWEQLRSASLETVAQIESRCLPAMVWMGCMGAPFAVEPWLALAAEAEAEAARLQAELDRTAPAAPEQLALGLGWKWGNPQIVRRVFAELGIELKATGDEDLAALDHPLADLLREWRAATTKVSRYGRNWLDVQRGGRIWADWQQMGSKAGRMSCWDPNLQNMPRDPRYRACIAAPAGRALVKADYSQIELRIACKISGDKRMMEAYRNGEDLHTLTARLILGRDFADEAERKLFRQASKAVNFGFQFGMGWETLIAYAKNSYGVKLTPKQAQEYRRTWFRNFRGIGDWHRSQPKEAVETRTLTGRRRTNVSWFTQKLNSPVQGTGADGLKRALALLWERQDQCPGAFPIIACHDELVVECGADQTDTAAEWLKRAMLDGMAPLIQPVPVEVDVKTGPTWGL